MPLRCVPSSACRAPAGEGAQAAEAEADGDGPHLHEPLPRRAPDVPDEAVGGAVPAWRQANLPRVCSARLCLNFSTSHWLRSVRIISVCTISLQHLHGIRPSRAASLQTSGPSCLCHISTSASTASQYHACPQHVTAHRGAAWHVHEPAAAHFRARSSLSTPGGK